MGNAIKVSGKTNLKFWRETFRVKKKSWFDCLFYTPHCNDDLNIINEQGNPMVNLSNLVLLQCKIAIFEIISPALLEILVGMHSPFCPIWRIFLPVYNRPSKTVQGKIFILMILHAQIAHLLKSTIEMSCSIILLRSSLQWGVFGINEKSRILCENHTYDAKATSINNK